MASRDRIASCFWGSLFVGLSACRQGLAQAPEQAAAPVAAAPPSGGAVSSEDVKRANDPLASLIGLSLHNYYAGALSETPDTTLDTFILRLATPFGRVLPRFSLPISALQAPDTSVSGLGDFNAFVVVRFTAEDAPISLGVGPLYVAPTASDDALGAGKHQLGGAMTIVAHEGPLLLAALVQYQHSVAGDDDRPTTSVLMPQIFGIFQLGGGYYMRASPTGVFNLESGDHSLPFGWGAGKVMQLGRTLINAFLEPQYTLLSKGSGQPVFQIFTGVNVQYKL